MKIEEPTEEDVEDIKKEVTTVFDEGRIEIKNDEDLLFAKEKMNEIGEIKKRVKKKKDSIVGPLREAKKNALDLFRPIENRIKEEESAIKEAINKFIKEVREREEDEREEIRKKVENGEIDPGEVGDLLEQESEALDEIVTRTYQKVKITDKSKLPVSYIKPNKRKIKKDLKSGIEIPGAELYEEEKVINR